MSDALKLAMRISAIDLFSGVLRRFRSQIVGTGKEAEAMQRRYDAMLRHTQAGLKALAVANYGFDKLKPAFDAASKFQAASARVAAILQGATGPSAKLAADMEAMKENAYQVSKSLKFPATAVMNVQGQLVQAGVPQSAILEGKHGKHGAAYMVELLAETKDMDPATVAMNVANIGHSFQLNPTQYGQAADIIAKASVLGSGTLPQLFHNLDQAGATAHLYGEMGLKSTAIALKALAPYGEEAGSDFAMFLKHLSGGSYRGQKWMAKAGLNFYDKHGNFIGLDASLQRINAKYGAGHVTPEVRNKVLGRVFGQTAGKALVMLMAPSKPGVKSYWEMKAAYDKQAGLVAQNEMVAKTFGFQGEKFESGLQNIGSSMFEPLVTAATHTAHALNGLTDSIATYAAKHHTFDEVASITAGVGLTAVTGYGLYRLGRGGIAGSPFLKRLLRGSGNTAAGIAEGKLVEKATGVAPVFVTNWPAAFGGLGGGMPIGGAAKNAEAAAEKTAATAAKAESAAVTAAGTAENAARAGFRFGGLLKGLSFLDGIALAPIPAESPAAMHQKIAKMHAQEAGESYWDKWRDVFSAKSYRDTTKVGGTVHIQIDQDGRARVTKVHTDNARVPLDVGMMMAIP